MLCHCCHIHLFGAEAVKSEVGSIIRPLPPDTHVCPMFASPTGTILTIINKTSTDSKASYLHIDLWHRQIKQFIKLLYDISTSAVRARLPHGDFSECVVVNPSFSGEKLIY